MLTQVPEFFQTVWEDYTIKDQTLYDTKIDVLGIDVSDTCRDLALSFSQYNAYSGIGYGESNFTRGVTEQEAFEDWSITRNNEKKKILTLIKNFNIVKITQNQYDGIVLFNWITGSARVIIKYSDFTTVVWKLDGSQYSRFIIDGYSDKKDEAAAHNFITRDGYQDILKTETIVVIQGPIYIDEATTLPSVLTVGVGPVFIFNNGRYIEGTWRRSDIDQSFELFDINQKEIFVPPSTQWVHILPLSGEVTWSQS